MMKYEIFKDVIEAKILDYLPEEYKNASVEFYEKPVNNSAEHIDVLNVVKEGARIVPAIDVNEYYNRYTYINDLDATLRGIADTIQSAYSRSSNVDLSVFTPDRLKQRVVFELVNARANAYRLQDSPCRSFNDLTITYGIDMGHENGQQNIIHVTNRLMEMMEVNEEELYLTAKENMKNIYPTRVMLLSEILPQMMRMSGRDDDEISNIIENTSYGPQIWIINNESVYGATALLDTDAFNEISKEAGENLLIIPSSIHEVLAIPYDGSIEPGALADFVSEVNQNEVSPEERLSNQVYRYNSRTKTIELASDTKDISIEKYEEESNVIQFKNRAEHKAPRL